MRAVRPERPVAALAGVVAAVLVVLALYSSGSDLGTLLGSHVVTLPVLVVAIVLGEVVRIRMPSGRDTAPLATATALAVVFLGPIEGQPPFDVDAGLVVLVVTLALLLAALVRRVRGRAVGVPLLAARVLGVGTAAWMARSWGPEGSTLWDLEYEHRSLGVVALAMALVAGLGLVVELLLVAAIRAERQRTPLSAAVRDELGEAAPLTFAVAVIGPMVALMAPVLGLLALPVALVPLAMAYSAVGQFVRNRATNRLLVATLSRLTEEGGYTAQRHAERVSELSLRMGRVLGLGEAELRTLEYAALLHDLGQITLRDPIPGGATVLAAPSDQRDIASEGAQIIRQAETLGLVADYVDAQTTPYRLVREHAREVPLPARIIKCANAFDDLSGGSDEPADVERAMERILLGLGYEYDPDVVDALTRVVDDAAVGRVVEGEVAAR
ncbi:HD-GYP domain-containing protein [Phycicoccus flavus]|uniref:HD domain-containing protein n=1 Tax=Phycicoccus flavus TaxID=2502783 RepID=A0A8T6QYF3_9MICO|nr:HD domain-containing phosphohydrolase [Phycicoccus flavus]NHA66878.1 HD domain-containing protein [Phycicoccus flavus]